MDWQNRWRQSVVLAALVALLGAVTSHAQQAPAGLRATTSAGNTGNQSPPTTFASRPQDRLPRTTFGRVDNDPQRANRLTNFDESSVPRERTDVTDDDPPRPPANANGALEPDLRSQNDRDAFDSPPAGHNPRFFQIELEPLTDRRTRQFFEVEPFAHIGWRLGRFILFQEFELAPAWDSNVLLSRDAESDWRADFMSETRLVSDWANHALELRMVHNRSYHRELTGEDDAEQTYELRGRIDITRRTNVEARGAHEIRQESRNSVDASGALSAPRSDVVTNRADVTLNHRFNRLSLQLRGGHADTTYEDDGSASDRDYERRSVAVRAQWEFRPTLSVFGEFEHDRRRHDRVATSDGLSRSSDGERYRAGVALGQTGEYLRGEASIGYGVQRPGASGLPDVEAFLVDANVAWRVTPLTSMLFNARTNFGETTLAGSPNVVERRVGAAIRHALTYRLIGEAGVSYATQDYRGTTLSERDVTVDANVEYSLNRNAALFTRFQHVRFRSSNAARDYNASTVMIGARLRN
ncbi:MAG: outer membrane beta-barrel protein [Hyphomicrobiaceae bacterium]